jgi:hypothetical protein
VVVLSVHPLLRGVVGVGECFEYTFAGRFVRRRRFVYLRFGAFEVVCRCAIGEEPRR